MIFFFPVKAEMLYFSKIIKGDQKGDHPQLYLSLNFSNFSKKKQEILKISKLNKTSGGPPFGPPFWFLKNIASKLSLEKKIIKKYSIVIFLIKFEYIVRKTTWNVDSCAPTRWQDLQDLAKRLWKKCKIPDFRTYLGGFYCKPSIPCWLQCTVKSIQQY